MSSSSYVKGIFKEIALTRLKLDPENPRLPLKARTMNQINLCLLLDEDFNLIPIGRSMADNGYFLEEPIIGVEDEDGNIIVIEGNRRIASVKLLIDQELRDLSSKKRVWDELADRVVELGHDFIKIPVILHETREVLNSILGFRHITGVLKWKPIHKARFINRLVEQKGPDAEFKQIAREIGSVPNTVRDNYITFRIYTQAKDAGIDTSNLENSFGVFYRSLSSSDVLKFLGVNKDQNIKKLRNPIRTSKSDELKEFIEFLHGTEDVPAVLSDSRKITELGLVLSTKPALEVLRLSRNLEMAYRLTHGEESSILKNLKQASYNLDEANKNIHRHKDNAEIQRVVELCYGTLYQILTHFPEIAEGKT